jgi:hypothetical protein
VRPQKKDHEELRGFARQIREIGAERVVEHGSGINGQISPLTLVPSGGLIIVANDGRGSHIADKVTRQARQEYLGIGPSRGRPHCPARDFEQWTPSALNRQIRHLVSTISSACTASSTRCC